VDVYLGFMMLSQQWPTEHAADLGLTICGDGKGLFSGYTLLVGGGENTWTWLFRKGEGVVGTTEKAFLLPQFGPQEPGDQTLHQQWINLRLARKGRLVTAHVQNRLALQFEDANPLSSGRIAVWSVNNGILIGRARVFRDQVSEYHVPLRAYPRFEDARLSNWVDGEISASVQETEPGTYRVTNLLSGGPFAVRLKPDWFPMDRTPILKFKCRVDPGASVDFYWNGDFDRGERKVRRGRPPRYEQTWTYRLTGSDFQAILRLGARPWPVPGASGGGTSENLSDGQWHDIKIDLKADLQGCPVFDLTFGNYSNYDYLLAGRSGNRPGATYELKDIELVCRGGN
jgi:hypothetical protein